MPIREQAAPLAAAVTALSTLLCCVPIGFAAAVATTSVGLFVTAHQGWFLAASAGLVVLGFVQLRRGRATCSTARRRVSTALLAVSAALVIGVTLFPQVIANLLADWLG